MMVGIGNRGGERISHRVEPALTGNEHRAATQRLHLRQCLRLQFDERARCRPGSPVERPRRAWTSLALELGDPVENGAPTARCGPRRSPPLRARSVPDRRGVGRPARPRACRSREWPASTSRPWVGSRSTVVSMVPAAAPAPTPLEAAAVGGGRRWCRPGRVRRRHGLDESLDLVAGLPSRRTRPSCGTSPSSTSTPGDPSPPDREASTEVRQKRRVVR